MSSPRFQIPRQPGTLKDAEAQLVAACGGIEKAAALTRVRPAQMHRYTAPSEPDCHMPVDVVLALEMHCQEPCVTRFLAFEAGQLLVDIDKGNSEEFATHLAAIGRDSGALYAEACTGLRDGTLTRKEAANVLREALKTVVSVSALVGDLKKYLMKGDAK